MQWASGEISTQRQKRKVRGKSAQRPRFSTCKAEVPKLRRKHLLTTAKTEKPFKDKRKVETLIENSFLSDAKAGKKWQSFWGKRAAKTKSCSKTTITSGQGAAVCQKVNRRLLMSTLVQYICTGAISMPYSQLAIIPLTHELQFLHWKRSDRPIWYWFFRQPHTVSCFGVQGVSTICWNSEERKSDYSNLFPYLQLRAPLWWQVLLFPNLPRERPKRPANCVSDCSNLVTRIPAVPNPFPYTVHLPIQLLTFPSFLAHLAILSSLPPATTTHFPQVM